MYISMRSNIVYKLIVCFVIILSLKGLFIPFDLFLFPNSIIYSFFLIFTLFSLLFLKPKFKVIYIIYIIIFYLLIHSYFFPNLLLSTYKYICYSLILLLLYNFTLHFKYCFDIFVFVFTIHCSLSLILHFYYTAFDFHLLWNIVDNPIFNSNNDVFKRAIVDDHDFYNPLFLFLVGNWTYDIMGITIYRFMGFSTEPTFFCIIIMPLMFFSLHHYKNTNIYYLIPVIVFTITLVFTFSLSCYISILIGIFGYYYFKKINFLNIFKHTIFFILLSVFFYHFIVKLIFPNKVNEIIFYFNNINLSSISIFNFLLGSKIIDDRIITYGIINVFHTYGIIGILMWLLLTYKILSCAYKLSKLPDCMYLSILLISLSFLSLKNVHLINFYFFLFLIYCSQFITSSKRFNILSRRLQLVNL